MPEFTTYPYTFTATSAASEHWNADGFKLTIPASAFSQSTSLTVSAPVKRAFYLRENSTTDKTYLASLGNYYKITRNSGVAPSLPLTVQLPFKAQFDPDKNMAKLSVYVCTQSVIEEDDPGNWLAGSTKSVPSGTALVAARFTVFGFFMAGHKINGRDDY